MLLEDLILEVREIVLDGKGRYRGRSLIPVKADVAVNGDTVGQRSKTKVAGIYREKTLLSSQCVFLQSSPGNWFIAASSWQVSDLQSKNDSGPRTLEMYLSIILVYRQSKQKRNQLLIEWLNKL